MTTRRTGWLTATWFLSLCMALSTSAQAARVYEMKQFVMSGSQEVPPNASTARAVGTVVVDTKSHRMRITYAVTGLVGRQTAAQVPGPAPRGIRANMIHALPTSSFVSQVWRYPESLEADILAGRTYIDIHSTAFTAGEIRGQIELEPKKGSSSGSGGLDDAELDADDSGPGRPELAVGPSATGMNALASVSNAESEIVAYVLDPDGNLVPVIPDPSMTSLRAEGAGGDATSGDSGKLTLAANPNPTRSGTEIRYVLPSEGPVRLGLYAVDGRRVATLVDETQSSGQHLVLWSGRSEAGGKFPPGTYFLRLEAGGKTQTTKIALTR